MADDTALDSDGGLVSYNPAMRLPEWYDKEEILKFLGVHDEMSWAILLKYAEVYATDPEPLNEPLQIPYRKSCYAQPEVVGGKYIMVTY
jgi:hypothetical protein